MAALEGLPPQFDALSTQFSNFRSEMRVEFESKFALRTEMHAGFADLRAQMLALHEDLAARISLILEGLPHRRKR